MREKRRFGYRTTHHTKPNLSLTLKTVFGEVNDTYVSKLPRKFIESTFDDSVIIRENETIEKTIEEE